MNLGTHSKFSYLIKMSLPFENLQAYKLSLTFVAWVDDFLKDRKLSARLADQLNRAALSIPLNIAEGAGRWHVAEKKQFFWIARGSTFECVAILQVLRVQKILHVEVYETVYPNLVEITKTLSGLIRTSEKSFSSSVPKFELL